MIGRLLYAEYSMESTDMRAPLAVLSVLWYHVIMKPFFTNSLSEEELKESSDLIDRYQTRYPHSSLFLFFKGRLWRLKKNLDAALQEYEKARVIIVCLYFMADRLVSHRSIRL